MRILVISNMLPPRQVGGYELACLNISRELRRRGNDVLVLTSPAERDAPQQEFVDRRLSTLAYVDEQPRDPGAKALVDHRNLASQRDNTLIIGDTLRRFRPDRVLLFNPIGLGALAVLDVVDRYGAPWTLNLGDRVPSSIREGVVPGLWELYDADALLRRGAFALVSTTLADEIAADGIDLGRRVRVIPRGVPPHGVIRSRPYRDGGVTRFVTAGALGPHKGTDLVLGAAARLHADGVRNFTVDIYGMGDSARFVELAEEAGIGEIVRFHPRVTQEELFRIHAESDAFLFPTWPREPFGSAPFEAASVGSVPILTGHCGAAEWLRDGMDCVKTDRSELGLARAMRSVVSSEFDLPAAGDEAIRTTRGPLSLAATTADLEEFLVSAHDDGRRHDDLAPRSAALDREALRILYAELDSRRA